jgi:hypothetical protein
MSRMPCSSAISRSFCSQAAGAGDEAALPLHRLHHDGGDVARVDDRHEAVRQVVDLPLDELLLGEPGGAAVDVGEREAVDLGSEGPEPLLEEVELGRHRHRHVGATVVPAVEHHDPLPLGVRPGDVDGGFDRFGPGVHEHGLLGEVAGARPVEHLGRLDHRLVGRDDGAHVDELVGLILDGVDHRLGCVAHRQHPDAAGHVDEGVAVDVGDERPVGGLDGDRGEFGVPVGSGGLAPGEDGGALRSGDLGQQPNGGRPIARGRHVTPPHSSQPALSWSHAPPGIG